MPVHVRLLLGPSLAGCQTASHRRPRQPGLEPRGTEGCAGHTLRVAERTEIVDDRT